MLRNCLADAYFGGEKRKRGKMTALEMREMPRKIQLSFTFENSGESMGKV